MFRQGTTASSARCLKRSLLFFYFGHTFSSFSSDACPSRLSKVRIGRKLLWRNHRVDWLCHRKSLRWYIGLLVKFFSWRRSGHRPFLLSQRLFRSLSSCRLVLCGKRSGGSVDGYYLIVRLSSKAKAIAFPWDKYERVLPNILPPFHSLRPCNP